MCQKRTRPCSPGAARAPRHLLLLARRSAPGQTPAALGATRTRQVCSAQPQSWFCLLNLKRRAGRSRRRAGGGGDPGRHACGAPSPRTATRRARDGPPRRRGRTERPCRRAPSPHVARLRPVGQVPPVGRVVFPADVLGVVPQGAHLRGTAGLSRVTQRQEGAVQTAGPHARSTSAQGRSEPTPRARTRAGSTAAGAGHTASRRASAPSAWDAGATRRSHGDRNSRGWKSIARRAAKASGTASPARWGSPGDG